MQAKRQIEYIQCEGFWIAGIGGDVLWLSGDCFEYIKSA